MVGGGLSGVGDSGKSSSNKGGGGSSRRDRGVGYGGEKEEGACRDDEMGEGGGPGDGGFRRGVYGGGGHVVGGSPDPKGERALLRHFPRGGDVEGSGRYLKLQAHSLHRLPQLSPWIPGRSRHSYRLPQGR